MPVIRGRECTIAHAYINFQTFHMYMPHDEWKVEYLQVVDNYIPYAANNYVF